MSENSVDSYINAQPEQVIDFNSFYNDYGRSKHGDNNWIDVDPNHWTTKFADFFTGDLSEAKSKYDAYLKNLENKNEFLATQSARQFDKLMDDTKYQRMMKDFEAAGLNPYLMINSGGVTASAAPSSSKASYKGAERREVDRSNNGRNIALLLLACAKIAATVL